MRALPLFVLLPLLACASDPTRPIPSSTPDDRGADASSSEDDTLAIPAVEKLPAVGDPGPPPGDPSSSSIDAGAPLALDASKGPPFDAGPKGSCTKPLVAGDLAIVELLVESVAGSGDHGEWIEVQSHLDCALDLRGLHGDAPAGAKVHTFDVTDDLWIAPRGTFLVADASDAALNHALRGPLVVWSGEPGDVLRNMGTTVSLRMNGALIDAVTYPSMKWTVGASIAFPAECPASARDDWAAWVTSTASWFPGFYGTPNGPNVGIRCPR
jgi:hypothetical protein